MYSVWRKKAVVWAARCTVAGNDNGLETLSGSRGERGTMCARGRWFTRINWWGVGSGVVGVFLEEKKIVGVGISGDEVFIRWWAGEMKRTTYQLPFNSRDAFIIVFCNSSFLNILCTILVACAYARNYEKYICQ